MSGSGGAGLFLVFSHTWGTCMTAGLPMVGSLSAAAVAAAADFAAAAVGASLLLSRVL